MTNYSWQAKIVFKAGEFFSALLFWGFGWRRDERNQNLS
jgi:hypothetical protein